MSTPLPTRASRRALAAATSIDSPPDVSPAPPDQPAVEFDPASAATRPRRSSLLIAMLCALLGFAIVLQVRQTTTDQLSTLRQDDLIRLLEDVTIRSEQLETEVARLSEIRSALLSGTDQQQAALEVATQRATIEGILSGRLPAQGPGIQIDIADQEGDLRASDLFNLLEELRNAGAEVVQVDNYRVTTSTAFTEWGGDLFLDGNLLPRNSTWLVIGDPATLERALEIPGGALPRIRLQGGTAQTTASELVQIDATAQLRETIFARPLIDAS